MEPEKKAPYDLLAANDKKRYDKEMIVWRAKEKEEKQLRESRSGAKNQPFDCVAALPSFVSMSAARNAMGEGNKIVDTSISLTDLIGGLGGDELVDILQPLQDRESRGVFNSSIYNNFNNNSYSMDPSSEQQSTAMIQQQQLDSSFASRQLSQLNNSIGKEQIDPYSNNTMNGVGFQNQTFNPSGGIASNNQKMMPWSNPRSAMIMENMLASSIDLEPVPLPDNHQQFQMSWSSQHQSPQQIHTMDQQEQRINIDSNNQYLRRVSTAGGSSLFSSGWGQNVRFNVDTNEPMVVPHADGNMNDETNEKYILSTNAANMVSQELDSMDNAKNRNGANQDPWKPIGLFKQDSK